MDKEAIRTRIADLETELQRLRTQLEGDNKIEMPPQAISSETQDFTKCDLENTEIVRYSRQIILPEIGVKGQMNLKECSALVVGAGGLGCPALLYLTAAGVGKIGIVDYDEVDISNLHRQVLHTEDKVGVNKVESSIEYLQRMNSNIKFHKHECLLTSQNAMEIIQKYFVVLDCTDNVATRYLLNDACVLLNIPLVSGSALRFEGQLVVYNYGGGPCFRCLHPIPPPPETVTNCSDGGVMGAVTGVIGALQALEVIKIICNQMSSFSERLLLYDGLEGNFRSIKLRNKKVDCPMCGANPTITSLQDYEQFCGSSASDKDKDLNILPRNQRITVEEFQQIRFNHDNYKIIDVRPEVEYKICSLHLSENYPLNSLKDDEIFAKIKSFLLSHHREVYFICKRGNDSQKGLQIIRERLREECNVNVDDHPRYVLKDVMGGFHAWSGKIDSNFPVY